MLPTAGPRHVIADTPPGVPTVVTLGDSVPAGTNCDCDPFPDLFAQARHAVSVNLAVSGATSSGVLDQLPTAAPALARADQVLLMTGANDVAVAFDSGGSFTSAADTVRVNVTATIQAIERIRPVPVVVLGYWNVVRDGQVGAASYGPDGVRAAAAATAVANNALHAAADATGATYVPTGVVFHGPDGRQDPTSLLAADGDHPDAEGHARIALALRSALIAAPH